MNSLLLCETAADLRDGLRLDGGASVVALAPEAAWACQQQQIPYSKTEDWISNLDILATVPETLDQQLRWADWLDSRIQAEVPELAELDFRPARCYLGNLRALLSELFIASLTMRRIADGAGASRVIYRPLPVTKLPLSLQQPGSLLRGVADTIVDRHYEACPLQGQENPDPAPIPVPRLQRLVKNLGPRLRSEMRVIRKAGFNNWLSSSCSGLLHHSGRVLMVGEGYDLDGLAIGLRSSGYGVDWITNHFGGQRDSDIEDYRRWFRRAAESLLANPDLDALLLSWGLNSNKQFHLALKTWFDEVAPQLLHSFLSSDKLIRDRQYAAVVSFEAGGAGTEGAVLAAARRQGRPTVVYQHGSSCRFAFHGYCPFILNSDCLFVYGEGTRRYFDQQASAYSMPHRNIVGVGSTRLDCIRNRPFTGVKSLRARIAGDRPGPLVLYVPTHYGSYGRSSSDLAGYPDVSYFELQQQVLSIFAEFPEVRLLYKDFPISGAPLNPIPEFLRKNVPNSMVAAGFKLTELMWCVDAIVLDHAITALGEALLTPKPILVYDEATSASVLEAPDAHELLRRRCSVAGSRDEFARMLRDLLQNPIRDLTVRDDAFMRQFCTDGNSVHRAAEAVLRIVGAHEGN